MAMAIVGGSIAISFALSLVLAAPIYRWISLDGMFLLLAAMGFVAILVALWYVPTPEKKSIPQYTPFFTILRRPELMRLNVGVFVLNATQVAMFLVVPHLLVKMGFPLARHWEIYLPVLLISFALMAPILVLGEKKQRLRIAVLVAIGLLFISQIVFIEATTILLISAALLIYFVGFNLLEALQPSLVSRWAQDSKGTALGIYNTTQSLGLFFGAAVGGLVTQYFGELSVFMLGMVLIFAWLIIAWSMRELPAKKHSQEAPAA
jgi:predicted MFS family arabinose efflux permease